jgi:RNA polymerase sigma-70 factor (ECF subfamily)
MSAERSTYQRSATEPEIPESLFGELYEHLHNQAGKYMRKQSPGHTLQPTALVHEVYLKLFRKQQGEWTSPQHFLAVAARTMTSVLIDHARSKGRAKRKASGSRVPLDAVLVHFEEQAVNLIDLHEKLDALGALGEQERRAATVVELRAFAGLTMADIAEYLATPKRTIERDFQFARAWLHRELGLDADGDN